MNQLMYSYYLYYLSDKAYIMYYNSDVHLYRNLNEII